AAAPHVAPGQPARPRPTGTWCAASGDARHAGDGRDVVSPFVGASERGLEAALQVLAPSPARLEHARVLVDLGATFRAAGQRTAAKEPLLDGLALAARCGARSLERRARAELAAIGVRPRSAHQTGADSLTPSEQRVAEHA